MKKYITILIASLISSVAFSQTALHSFECHLQPTVQGMTQSQIETNISKGNFEQYRLMDQRTTLSFDNGFEIVLLSANEAAHLGLITNTAGYQTAYPAHYKLPVFHMDPQQGWTYAQYTTNTKNYKGR